MKAIKCELWVGVSTNFFKFGTFESIAAAKRAAKYLGCYREIRRKDLQNELKAVKL